MANIDIQLQKIIQGGVYYTTNPSDGKDRPYVIMSNNHGYALNPLAFKVTSKMNDRTHVVPILLNRKISFVSCSETIEMGVSDLLNASFVGTLNPFIFDICIMMYSSRFANIDVMKLNDDMCEYLDLLEAENIPLYDDQSIIFNRNLLINKYKRRENKDNEKYDYRKAIKDPAYRFK